ncbi:MAG: hemerythrin domain-containing protein, partial [Candidatus Eremiobacteraeota bacterium]|nr:hemerythrin domain-containing protein [Candidatus Eremiobacteraeota bacterium]
MRTNMPAKRTTQHTKSSAARNGKSRAVKKTGSAKPRTRASANGADVLTLLHQDHQTVGDLIDEVQDCEPGDRRLQELGRSIAAALTVHAKIEEDFFYPEL